MEHDPIKVSIIIRAYNAEATIARALSSAIAQDFDGHYEIVVVDDGSTDGTAAVIQQFVSDTRVKPIRQQNQGAARAAAAGVAGSSGNIMVFLDADDELLPATLREATLALSDGSLDYAYGDYLEEYKGSQKYVVATDPFKAPAGALVWRRDRIAAAGGFQADTVFPEYEILLRMWNRWSGVHVGKSLFVYHRSDASITGDKKAVEAAITRLRAKFPARAREIEMIRNYDPLSV